MTIRTFVDVRELNSRLGHIETCSENAPKGTFEIATEFNEAMNETFAALIESFRSRGFHVPVNDGMREIEAMVAGFILASDKDDLLASAEGFGKLIYEGDADSNKRVIAGIERDRDFLRGMNDLRESIGPEGLDALTNA